MPPGGCYATTVAYSHGGETWIDDTPCVTAPRWALSENRYLVDNAMSDDQRYRWSVQAVDQGGGAISPMSEVRTVEWQPKPPPDDKERGNGH